MYESKNLRKGGHGPEEEKINPRVTEGTGLYLFPSKPIQE
jgi:hypothetical protein